MAANALGPSIEEEADPPTATLVREAIGETRDLVRLEVALAREELESEIAGAKLGALALGSAAGAFVAAFTMFMVAVALAFRAGWLAAVVVGAFLLVVAAAVGVAGWKALPKRFFGKTTARLTADLRQFKDRIA